MTKRTIFTGAMAAFLVAGLAVTEAQGRRGQAGPLGPGQRQGQVLGPRGGQLLGAPGRGFGARGGRRGGGPMAGFARLGLTDDQQAKLKTILSDAQAAQLAARTKTHEAILAILTPEQKAKLGKK